MSEQRRLAERRRFLDRRLPRDATDVTRAEHENLYSQVQENVRTLRRLEDKLDAVRELLEHRPRFKDVS
jgi:hypothetical protein